MNGKPMTAGEFKPCSFCGKGVMHAGVPLFYRVTIEGMGVDLRAAQRAHGMEQYFGGAVALARVFEDPNIGMPIGPPVTSLVCQECAVLPHSLALLAETK